MASQGMSPSTQLQERNGTEGGVCVCKRVSVLQLDCSENSLSYQYTYLCMRSLAHICSYKRGIAPANELCMGCCLVYTVHYVIQFIYIAPIIV